MSIRPFGRRNLRECWLRLRTHWGNWLRQYWTLNLLASIFIIIVSSVAFLYWFRYTCLLVIRQGRADYALKVASTVRLSFSQVQESLQTERHTAGLDSLHQALEGDYHLLTELLEQLTGEETIERRLLTLDYKAMRMWYRLSRNHPDLLFARTALTEMSSILGYFASEIGQSAAG